MATKLPILVARSLVVVFPGGRRQTFTPKGGSAGGKRAGAWATELAKGAGLPVGKSRWQLRGPIGILPPKLMIRSLDLRDGEYLTLEPSVKWRNSIQRSQLQGRHSPRPTGKRREAR